MNSELFWKWVGVGAHSVGVATCAHDTPQTSRSDFMVSSEAPVLFSGASYTHSRIETKKRTDQFSRVYPLAFPEKKVLRSDAHFFFTSRISLLVAILEVS